MWLGSGSGRTLSTIFAAVRAGAGAVVAGDDKALGGVVSRGKQEKSSRFLYDVPYGREEVKKG